MPLSGAAHRERAVGELQVVLGASSRCAATFRALATTFCAAFTTAMPPTASEREPYVSMPLCETCVSPCSTSTSSNGTPSWSATIWLHAVS